MAESENNKFDNNFFRSRRHENLDAVPKNVNSFAPVVVSLLQRKYDFNMLQTVFDILLQRRRFSNVITKVDFADPKVRFPLHNQVMFTEVTYNITSRVTDLFNSTKTWHFSM